MNSNRIKEREIELDLLRIIALLAVISVHSTGMGSTDTMLMSNPSKLVLVFFDSIVTWQIPVYVMISGRFFLDPERMVTKDKLLKAILRIVIAFTFWDIVYQIFYITSGMYCNLNWKGIVAETLTGPYHFWYLFMIIFLYAITPFLRQIATNKRLSEYFIILFFFFEFLYGYGCDLPVIGGIVVNILNKANFSFAMGYSGYYILGYYLYKHGIPKRFERGLYLIAALLFIMTSCATIYCSILDGMNNEVFTGYLKPNIIVVACAIYVFFLKKVRRIQFNTKWTNLITRLSEYSFGVYLLHALIINILDYIGLSPVIITPFIMHPMIVALVFVISNVAVGFIRKIPVVGKRIT